MIKHQINKYFRFYYFTKFVGSTYIMSQIHPLLSTFSVPTLIKSCQTIYSPFLAACYIYSRLFKLTSLYTDLSRVTLKNKSFHTPPYV